jgi:predicted lysophospholipase L1 biosynthesis ABC-type transport system permease subunit
VALPANRNGLRAQRDSFPRGERGVWGVRRSTPQIRVRFALSLAWRESRAQARRGLLIVLSVAIGVAALVAINSFTDNLRGSVQREARALLARGRTDVVKDVRALREEFQGRAERAIRTLEKRVVKQVHGATAALERRVAALERRLKEKAA